MGGFAFYRTESDDIPTVEESLFELSTNPPLIVEVPNFRTFAYITKYFPHILTNIPKEHILDRAESSGLSKALLIVQVAWFCTNCASRLHQRLPLSLLEVSTAAHAFCTLLTYFVWWSKPANVAAPTILRGKEVREVYALLKCSDEEYEKALEMARKLATGDLSMLTGTESPEKIILAANALQHLLPSPEQPPILRDRNLTRRQTLIPGAIKRSLVGTPFYELIAVIISPALYGVIHFLAWSEQFPTRLEHLFWQASSFVITLSGLLLATVVMSANPLAWFLLITMTPIAHMLASGFLVVESFRQLFFLDPAAYQLPSWSNYWPHLS
jgi:hypothetical protein